MPLREEKFDWDVSPGRKIQGRLAGETNLTGTSLREEISDRDVSLGRKIPARV